MGASLREIGYGVLFLLCATVGAVFIGPMLFIGLSKSHEESAWQIVKALVVGSAIGGGLWLWFKYSVLTPRPPKGQEQRSI